MAPKESPEAIAVKRLANCNAASRYMAKRILKHYGVAKVINAKGPKELHKLVAEFHAADEKATKGDDRAAS